MSKMRNSTIFKIFQFFGERSFTWNLDADVDICIYNKTGSQYIVGAIEQHNYCVIDVENCIYSKQFLSIVFQAVISLNFSDLYFKYLCQIVDSINPKVLITYIDNDKTFWRVDRNFSNRIKVITIQNGSRFFSKRDNIPNYHANGGYFYDEFDKVYHSNFACISNYEVDLYSKHKAEIGQYHPIGSLSISRHIENYKKRKKIFDICFVAGGASDRFTKTKVWKYLAKYASENDVSICIALKYNHHCDNYAKSVRVFEDFFLGSTVIVIPHTEFCVPEELAETIKRKKNYVSGTQYLSDISELTIGLASTSMRQVFARGNKICPINFEEKNTYGVLGLLDSNMKPTYDEFVEQVERLLSIESAMYLDKNQNLMRYFDIFNPSKTPKEQLRELVSKSINYS